MAMFGDLNKVMLMGNVTNDPDLRYTPGGAAVLNFGMATNRRYKQGEEWKDEVTFHNLVVWRNAESLAKRLKKGTKILVEGRLQTRTWEGQDGKKNYKTEVVADDVTLIARYEGEGMGGGNYSSDGAGSSDEGGSSSSSTKSSKGKSKAKAEEEVSEDIDPNDLPF